MSVLKERVSSSLVVNAATASNPGDLTWTRQSILSIDRVAQCAHLIQLVSPTSPAKTQANTLRAGRRILRAPCPTPVWSMPSAVSWSTCIDAHPPAKPSNVHFRLIRWIWTNFLCMKSCAITRLRLFKRRCRHRKSHPWSNYHSLQPARFTF